MFLSLSAGCFPARRAADADTRPTIGSSGITCIEVFVPTKKRKVAHPMEVLALPLPPHLGILLQDVPSEEGFIAGEDPTAEDFGSQHVMNGFQVGGHGIVSKVLVGRCSVHRGSSRIATALHRECE